MAEVATYDQPRRRRVQRKPAPKGEAPRWLAAQVTGWVSDECLYWPFGKCNGYGTVYFDGKVHYAHRWMCQQVHGPAPAGHEAAHSCGNGHKGCVNPRHVSWKTKSDNQLDRALHGTASAGCRGKLKPGDAEKIRALRGKHTQAEIAAMFGCSRANVSLIQNGKHQNGPRRSPQMRAILAVVGAEPMRIATIMQRTNLSRKSVTKSAWGLVASNALIRVGRGWYMQKVD